MITTTTGGHRRFDRSLVPLVVGILLLTAGFSTAPARGDVPLLTHPDASWSLRLDLPGFVMKPPRILRDRSQVWVLASNKGTGVMATVFVEKMTNLRETSECRDTSLKKMAVAKKRMTLSDAAMVSARTRVSTVNARSGLPPKRCARASSMSASA